MNKTASFITVLCFLTLVGGTSVLAGNGTDTKFTPGTTVQPAFWVDYASFMGAEPGTVRLEVYYKVFNFGLSFHQQGDKYVAQYELQITVEDKDEIPVKVYRTDKTVTVADLTQARSRFDFRTSQVDFELAPGKYKLKFTLQDSGADGVFRYDDEFKLEDFRRDSPTFSDVVFVRHVGEARSDSGIFNKGNLEIVPSVSRDYEGEENSRVLFYMELYKGDSDADRVLVETIIRNRRRGMIYRDTLTTLFEHDMERQLREISSAEFPPGEYEMELILRGRRNKKLDQHRVDFTVVWSQRALLKHDFKTAMNQLELIAQAGEVDKIRELETIEERSRAFNDFWLARDPSIGTVENEVKREFYRRINYANRQFGHLQRPGWTTDRGRTYVRHGEPDQIDDIPMSAAYLPYQIWHYYRRGEYLRFLFVDEDLDGDYRLQFPYDGRDQTPDF